MALINCPECGKEISDKASACPSCGCPINKEETSCSKSNKKNILIPIILIAFLGIFAILTLLGNNLLSIFGNKTTFSEDLKAIEKVDKSVVKIICYDYFGEEMSTGSGFVAFDKNTIVTNFHVIEGAYSVVIQVSEEKVVHVEYELCSSKENDLAILKTKVDLGLTPLKLGNSESIPKGEEVVAIGSPLGLVNTVSTGVLSGRVKEECGEVLQFTAPISSGSSGGALFNSKGEVIGVTYASYIDGQNLNLAIPIEDVIELYDTKDQEKYTDFAEESFPELELFAKYGEIYQVTLSELRSSPHTYSGKYVVFYAYVSSVGDYAGVSLTDDESYISADSLYDYEYLNEVSWSRCPYLQGVRTPVSEGYNCSCNSGDIVMVIGKFSYVEKENDDSAIIWLEYYR